MQRRFWFLDRIGQGHSVPNVILPLRLKGPIDFDAMVAAVNTLLVRHEALRMRIGDRDGEPYPKISPGREDLMTVADSTALPNADREREGNRLSNELTGGDIRPRYGSARQGAVRSDFHRPTDS